MRQKIQKLLIEVKRLEEVSNKAAHESNRAANEASAGLIASYSAAGDAEHARNSANLSLQKAATLKKLMVELESSLSAQIPITAKFVCFVSVELGGGATKDLYLVENPVFISGFNLISPDSPLGAALLEKRAGDLFLYKSGTQSFSGKILEIE